MVSLPLAVYLTPVYADSAGFGLSLAFVGLMLALSGSTALPTHWFSIGSSTHAGSPQTFRFNRYAHFHARCLLAVDTAH